MSKAIKLPPGAIVGPTVAESLAMMPEGKPKKSNPYAPYRSKWEQEYAKHLDARKAEGLLVSWQYELCSFALLPSNDHQRGVRYTPDFIVMNVVEGVVMPEVHEVKGHWFSLFARSMGCGCWSVSDDPRRTRRHAF
jgi:hypothetical protein